MHGDDFTALGWQSVLDWYRKLLTGRFEAKVKGRIGPGEKDGKSMRELNRMIHWTDWGIEYKADQRHAEIIMAELGLGAEKQKCRDAGHPDEEGDIRGRRGIDGRGSEIAV